MSQEPAICIRGLVFHYGEDIPALNGIDADIADNTYLAIVGQNGSGKTTLVKHLNGLLKPSAGSVTVYGIDTRSATVGQLAHTVGYAFQNPDHQIFCATTREEIAFGPRNLGLTESEVASRAQETLAAFGLTPFADVPPAVLGYGLRRKVAVAAVYAMRPRVLILDEPTSGLDRRSADELLALVDALHREGHTIILVTHDMRLVAEHCQEILVIHEGLILDRGPTREVFRHVDVLAQAQLLPPQITRLAGRLGDVGIPPDVLNIEEFCAAVHTRLRRKPQ
ncbi:MAG: ATP-binding cassette domain-containing protein [Chloroflexi bacterium]|nr:ATP-binding cassette domain-containing protein [Chloroflexota bacterium]